jgi:hypothetical protein
LFHPDQFNPIYTGPSDVWMTVTDWTSAREIDSQFSNQFTNPRVTVIAEEEFEPIDHDIARRALIGPLTPRPGNVTLQQQVATAYKNGSILRILA